MCIMDVIKSVTVTVEYLFTINNGSRAFDHQRSVFLSRVQCT